MIISRKKRRYSALTRILLRTRAQIVFTNPYNSDEVARDVDPTDTSRRRRVRPDWQRS